MLSHSYNLNKPGRRRRIMLLTGVIFLTFLVLTSYSRTQSDPELNNRTNQHYVTSYVDVDASDDAMLDELHQTTSPFMNLSHLIMVAGHAVLTTSTIDSISVTKPDSWLLLDYQKRQLSTFIGHISSGVKLAARLHDSLLLFSGGETRRSAGPRSEAQSYWLTANAMNWFDENDGVDWLNSDDMNHVDMTSISHWSVRSRSQTEEHARDSFENLVFSICRYHELTGRYPQHITVIGFAFKSQRFVELHRNVMRYPRERFTYIGIDPVDVDIDDGERLKLEREHGEAVNSLKPFTNDPHGCHAALRSKKQQRNPWHRSHGYGHDSSCPHLKALLHHCGNDVYVGPLPWDSW